jgi:hypothetical protein
MSRLYVLLALFISFSAAVRAADLTHAPSDQLLSTYKQLRSLQGSTQGALTENVVFKRDAATFTFTEGKLTFAAPVAGRVMGVVFEGRGTFELDPPGEIEQRQIARYGGGPKLVDSFRRAVFFFSDDSYKQLQSLLNMGQSGSPEEATKAFADAQGIYQNSFNDWWSNARAGNPQMQNLAARLLSDLTDSSSRGLFLADFKGEHSGDLLFQISWNRPSILLPYENIGDEVMLLHINRNGYYEWMAGFHLADEYASSPHPDHRTLLAHCLQETVDLDVSKDNRVSATAEMKYQVNEGAPRLLPLKLQGVLRISEVMDGTGQKLVFIQEDRKLDNDPWIILPAPARVGTPGTVKITYQEDSTHDSHIIENRGSGLFFVGARESWFPSFGAFDDRTNFVVNVHSPKKYKFLATGEPEKSQKEKDFQVTDWKSDIPLSVIGFNYGDFVAKSQSDRALTVTAYAGKEIPDELKSLQDSLAVAHLAHPGLGSVEGRLGIMTGGFNTASNAQYAANISFQALKFFEYCFGSLPFKHVSVTEQPVRGFGQSWPTLIFLPYDSLLDTTTRQSLHLQDSGEAREFYNLVAVHEMAHQWWGHVVGWKTYHDQWLSEGFAEFSASLYLRQFEPKKLESFWEMKRQQLLSKDRAGHRPVDVGPLWLGAQLPSYHEPDLYRNLIYNKGAYVLEMLRAIMYNSKLKNPNEPFLVMMRDFVSTYAGKSASTEDFRRIVEKHMGRPMDWFFTEWVYGTETPHYSYKVGMRDLGQGKTELSLSVTQSRVSRDFRMSVPIDVFIKGQPHQVGLATLQGSQTINGKVVLGFRPEKVELDADKSVLCTMQ